MFISQVTVGPSMTGTSLLMTAAAAAAAASLPMPQPLLHVLVMLVMFFGSLWML